MVEAPGAQALALGAQSAKQALLAAPEPSAALARQDGTRPLRVMLDPGHGGRDPGAERQGQREADLMLTFALELAEELIRSGFEVDLTRRTDVFVPLEQRMTLSRAFRADAFLSLHADSVAEGQAQGISVYTFADAGAETAAQKLAERHAPDDLLTGVDLTGQEDALAKLLMSLAQSNTQPRSEALARSLIAGFERSVGGLYPKPMLAEEFAVLKAPDIPSVLIELGFMSSPTDLANLLDPDWRALAQAGIAAALQDWALADAAEARLIWQ